MLELFMSPTKDPTTILPANIRDIFAPLAASFAQLHMTAYFPPVGNALLNVIVPSVVAVNVPVPELTVILPARSVPSMLDVAPDPQPEPIVNVGVPEA